MSAMRACREAFTSTLLELAKQDSRIIALTSDARGSVSLTDFAAALPKQFVEVGIAEQNEVGIAAGLATCGKISFACAPACFLTARSLEQIKVDVAYTGTNVKIVGVSGGVSYGALGTSHHTLHDAAVFRAMHGIVVLFPCDARQTIKMTEWLAAYDGPAYMRMGRGPVPDVYDNDDAPFIMGKANTLRAGTDLTIIATGEMVRNALDAAADLANQGIDARVLDMHTLKPLDEEAVITAAQETGLIITVEEHSVYGGLGAAVAQVVVSTKPVPMVMLGIPDEDAVPGKSAEIFEYYGLHSKGIASAAAKAFAAKNGQGMR
jgi:transketolase